MQVVEELHYIKREILSLNISHTAPFRFESLAKDAIRLIGTIQLPVSVKFPQMIRQEAIKWLEFDISRYLAQYLESGDAGYFYLACKDAANNINNVTSLFPQPAQQEDFNNPLVQVGPNPDLPPANLSF